MFEGPDRIGDNPANPLFTYRWTVVFVNFLGALGERKKLCFDIISLRDNGGDPLLPLFLLEVELWNSMVANFNLSLNLTS